MIRNSTRNTCLATEPHLADNFFKRLKGLLGTKQLAEGAALIISPCSSIHTFGMNYPIDVVFVDANDKVAKIVNALAPGHIAGCRNASYVIELPAGTAEKSLTQVGDRITRETVS